MSQTPVIIEAAINGGTTKARNAHVPLTPEEIAKDSLACIEAGAAIIHSHLESFDLNGKAAAERYLQGWRSTVRARPDAISAILPTTISWPAAFASSSERPTVATSGSV